MLSVKPEWKIHPQSLNLKVYVAESCTALWETSFSPQSSKVSVVWGLGNKRVSVCPPTFTTADYLLTVELSSFSGPLWWIKGNCSCFFPCLCFDSEGSVQEFFITQCLMWFFQTCTSETLNIVTAQRGRSVLPDFFFTAMGTTAWFVLLLPLTLCIDREGT